MHRSPGIRVVTCAILAILAGGPAPARGADKPSGEKYAILVGVRKYDPAEPLPALAYSEADMDELRQVLLAAGYQPENIKLMTQTAGAENPRFLPIADKIRKEFALTLKRLDESDSLVVALAGHGVQFSQEGESFFCPADAALDDESSLIKLGDLAKTLEACQAGFKLLLVDACRNNPKLRVARASGRAVIDLPSLSRPFVRRAAGGVAALFSCSAGEIAFENPELKHGVFFHYVIEGLRGDADLDRDGQVEVEELAAFAKKNVARFVDTTYGKEQYPELVNRTRGAVAIVSLDRGRTDDEPVTKTESRPSQSDQARTELASRTSPFMTPRPSTPDSEPGKSITNSIGMKLVLIPAGEFEMGSPDDDKDASDDEKPRHRVRITQSFYLSATEVTQGKYNQVMGKNPSRFSAGGTYAHRVAGQSTDRHPVENVSWNDAITFCNKLSERDGLKPYYQFGSGARSGGNGYRLPTEAEWEYACRAGNTTRYSFGDDASRVGEHAWYSDNSGSTTHPVGQKLPNAFGLYDMHGNVYEWCWDGYDESYYGQSRAGDPPGPSQATGRVSRGGSWNDSPRIARSAYRDRFAPGNRNYRVGFRVARVQSGG